jgi:hypothetical protein
MNFLTIGYDCSTASALKNLGLRNYALPFDWTIASVDSIEKCFIENFQRFHTGLYLNYKQTRLKDTYGFEFPHDYPTIENDNRQNEESVIVDDWNIHYDVVREKYKRRIERFYNIVNDDKPIIILSRYKTQDVIKLKQLFIKYFNKRNIYFINAYCTPYDYNNITNFNPEINGSWNDTNEWRKIITIIINRLL